MTRPPRYWTACAVVTILAGAWLRLYDLAAMEFKGDEQEGLNLAMRLLNDQPWLSGLPFPTHGMVSSSVVHNPPLYTWIIAALWAPTQDPVAVARLIALINVLCLFPLWLWARRRMDEPRALLTLALCAVSPFAVIFSRKIWPVDLLLPGVLAVLWGIEWVRGPKPWRGVILLLLAVLVAGQLHLSAPIALALAAGCASSSNPSPTAAAVSRASTFQNPLPGSGPRSRSQSGSTCSSGCRTSATFLDSRLARLTTGRGSMSCGPSCCARSRRR